MNDANHARAADLAARLASARLVVLDVDGTLTDGGIAYLEGDEKREVLRFHVHDGIASEWLRAAGLKVAWISGRASRAAAHRASVLKIDVVALGVGDKRAELERVQRELSIAPEATVSMGDDVPDLGLRARSSVFAAPADACVQVRAVADVVTSRSGGHGALRELAEAILRARGSFDALVAGYSR